MLVLWMSCSKRILYTVLLQRMLHTVTSRGRRRRFIDKTCK